MPLRTWFYAAWLVATTKKSISSMEIARKPGVHPETRWYVHHKLLYVLGSVPLRQLFGIVEADEAFVGGKRPQDPAGRGTSKPLVLGLVENREGKSGNVYLKHIPDASRQTIEAVASERVAPGSILVTDGWKAYRDMDGFVHEPQHLESAADAHVKLPWVHRVFSNVKRIMYGVHSYRVNEHPQPFLDGFAYRYNYRNDLRGGLLRALRHLVRVPPHPNAACRLSGAVPSK